MNKNQSNAWICPICGYVHYGSLPPEECPVCGTSQDMFEPYEDAAPTPEIEVSVDKKGVIIVGAGVAGVSAAEALRKSAPEVEITLISNEPDLPYYRLNLTRYLIGELNLDQLLIHPESWYLENNIHLMRCAEVLRINLPGKEVELMDGKRIPYDQLILTVGSHPFIPPILGVERKNVTTLRSLKDADFILENSLGMKRVVCIGGGLLGLETAAALARRGNEVSILEGQAWLLPRQLNEHASMLLQKQVRSIGIDLYTGVRIREFVGDEAVTGVLLEDGTLVAADLVVISAGVRSNLEIARQAGLQVKQGILVDNTMRTSNQDIFTAGDAAEYDGVVYGIWGPSQIQGSIAGMVAGNQKIQFQKIPRSNSLKVMGISLFSIGRVNPLEPSDIMIDGEIKGNYYCFIFNNNQLVGSILLGEISNSAKVKSLAENKQDFRDILLKKPVVNDLVNYIQNL